MFESKVSEFVKGGLSLSIHIKLAPTHIARIEITIIIGLCTHTLHVNIQYTK